LAAQTFVGDAEYPVGRSAGDAIPERDGGRWIRLDDHAIFIDDHDRKEVGLKQLSIPELDLAALCLSSLDAASLDHCALDVCTNEDRDPVYDCEVDQIVCGVAPRIGKGEIGNPQQGRPESGRRRAGQPVAQGRVQHREEQQSHRAARRKGGGSGGIQVEVEPGQGDDSDLHCPEGGVA